jgi:hypothetical protein
MIFRQPTRRGVLKASTAILTISVSAKHLGLRAAAQVPDKIVLGTQAITPAIESYLGATDFFKEGGLTVELTRFNSFAPSSRRWSQATLQLAVLALHRALSASRAVCR